MDDAWLCGGGRLALAFPKGVFMSKQWQCRKGHVLGVISENGSGVPQLMVYRHAVDAGAETPAEVDVMIGPLIGQMPVQCDLCGDVQVWKVSVSAQLYLIEMMPTHLLFEFWNRLLERAKGTPSVLRTSPPNTPAEIFGGEQGK